MRAPLLAAALLLADAALLPARAVDQPAATASPATAAPAASGILLRALGGVATRITQADLAGLPPYRTHTVFETGHGQQVGDYAGVSVWELLGRTGAMPRGPAKKNADLVVHVSGHDGYTIAIAEGEIDPAFEGKQVLLARKLDATGAPGGAWRLVVPGDLHGARYVDNVAAIVVR